MDWFEIVEARGHLQDESLLSKQVFLVLDIRGAVLLT